MSKKYNVAVMGATGAVGTEFLRILEERKFPVADLRLLASSRSRGKKLFFDNKEYVVEELTRDSFEDIELVLASAGAARSKEFLPGAVKAGAVCVDNSSAFRMEQDVPLCVPEVNPGSVKGHRGIIANPNCSTIQMVVALAPIHRAAGIKRVVVSTYQSVSGAGQKKVAELAEQAETLSGKDRFFEVGRHAAAESAIREFNHQIAYNLIPHIDVFLDNGYTREEMKMVLETRKIMGEPGMAITATAVRVPVFYAHSESINIVTDRKVTPEEVKGILRASSGVTVVDDFRTASYPMPIHAEGRDEVFVGRIREDESCKNGINLWVVSDNLRKGAALNAIQIAELLYGISA